MAEIFNVRPRPGVRINLHAQDIRDIVKQPEVLASFTEGELQELIDSLHAQLNYLQNRKTGE